MKKTITAGIRISEIKRLHVGLTITFPCPECKTELTHDFTDRFLEYAQVGKEDFGGAYCDQCEDFVIYPFTIKTAEITIEYDPDAAKFDH